MNIRLYVGNLRYEVDAKMLSEHFSQIGEVVRSKIVYFEESAQSRGFGFIDFKTNEEAQKAIETLNGTFLMGRRLNVALAKQKDHRKEA